MPSYYHTSKLRGRSNSSPNAGDAPMEEVLAKDELVRSVVMYAKTWTKKTWVDIAEEAQTSVKHAKNIWGEVKESEEQQAIEDLIDPEIKQQLREYDLLKYELMTAWRDSKADKTKEKVEDGYTSKGDILKNTTEVTQRDPKVEYLTEIRMINQERRKLLGIEKHVEINFNQQNNNQYNFDSAGEALVAEEHNEFIHKPEDVDSPSLLGGDSDEVLPLPE